MKINGPNPTNFNPYKKIMEKQAAQQKEMKKQDQVEISEQAKQLQETDKPNAKRAAYVQEIKQAIQSGEYKVNAEKTAQKMIDFWSSK
ncbi:flagellar biosynthesis anti-sigma factor FlgM [Oceanobacillus piezotolerans]|uniref:Negative regulator of flagellin synthesis n=1 Tax=Oceanobacillus piezotolerans TaxID=2448030 RepID=A0A498D9N4_9BACI|nr:flagellar biosynthesis anti-sigma factor FlgM [Oceanobacillus piezotolerans]RLL47123.1 flagellar biosynthesis anti-sigma factor FlgM [Oceanobacillus piezotolerans]